MHSLSIVFGPAGTNWRFLFKSADSARTAANAVSDALNKIRSGPTADAALLAAPKSAIYFADDFGQHAEFSAASIHGFMLEDLDQTKLAAVEMTIHNGRAQADAEQAMRADPKIMASAHRRAGASGPPILAPMGNGFTR